MSEGTISTQKRILDDLEARGLTFGAVVAYDSEKNQLVCISYDYRGLINKISTGDSAVSLYGKAHVDERAMRELFTLGVNADERDS